MVIGVLRLHKLPIQSGLIHLFKELKLTHQTPCASAFCHARKKLKASIFSDLNHLAVDTFTSLHQNILRRFQGKRLLAVDGSLVRLKDTPALREAFPCHRNHHKGYVAGLGLFLFDVLNDLTLHATLSAREGEANVFFREYLEYLPNDSVVLLDRGFTHSGILSFFTQHSSDVVVRLQRMSFSVVKEFQASQHRDMIVNFTVSDKQRQHVQGVQWPTDFPIRLIKIPLSTGEIEILGTTLLDQEAFPYEDFQWLYQQRWGIETFFCRLKTVFEIERFRGYSPLSIQQEFQGIVFLSNLERMCANMSQTRLKFQTSHRLFSYQVNHSVGYTVLRSYLIQLFFFSIRSALKDIAFLMTLNPVIIRKGRKEPRWRDVRSKQLNHLRYHMPLRA